MSYDNKVYSDIPACKVIVVQIPIVRSYEEVKESCQETYKSVCLKVFMADNMINVTFKKHYNNFAHKILIFSRLML